MVRCESCPSKIGHITLDTKQTGAPSAGNPHAGCDVAGAGDGFTVWLLRHSQRKRGATARLDLRNTAPVLDPTGKGQPKWPTKTYFPWIAANSPVHSSTPLANIFPFYWIVDGTPYLRHFVSISSTLPAICWRASARSTPLANSASYWV